MQQPLPRDMWAGVVWFLRKSLIMVRFKKKRFSAGANRDQMLACQEMGLDLYKFVAIGLSSMKEIAAEIGLASPIDDRRPPLRRAFRCAQ